MRTPSDQNKNIFLDEIKTKIYRNLSFDFNIGIL